MLGAEALAPVAFADPASSLPGPTSFSVGLVDDPTFLDASESELIRGGVVRPGTTDLGRMGATARLLAVHRARSSPAPDEPGRPRVLLDGIPNTWRSNTTLFGQFARVVATRYSGAYPDPLRPHHRLPRVASFRIWNEPNLRINLSPQWTRDRRGRPVPASPEIYRALLNAGYANVKTVQRHATVLAAGLGPYGDPPGVDRMHPVAFMRQLLCLSGQTLRRERCQHPAHFDAIDDHPYSATPTTHACNRDDVSVPDLGRLTHVVTVALRRRTLLPHGRKSAWMTEIFWPSKPPDPAEIPLVQQARRLSLAFYELWRQGVGHMFWFLIRDYPHKSESGAGLFFVNGRMKPSSVAFQFPFAAVRDQRGMTTLWGRAPSRGVVTVQRATRHGWRTLLRRRTTAGGVFYTRTALPRHLLLRAMIGQSTSISFPEG